MKSSTLAILLCTALLTAGCGGGSSGSGSPGGGSANNGAPAGLLAGEPQAAAAGALPAVAPVPAAAADWDGEALLTRISVVLTRNAKVADVNAAAQMIGASGFAFARPNSPFFTFAIPRQDSVAALDALAARLRGQPGILVARGGRSLSAKELPNKDNVTAPINEMDHLLATGFPAAWNLRALAQRNCASRQVVVMIPDLYVGTPPGSSFDSQLPDFAAGATIPATPNDNDPHGFDVAALLAGEFDAVAPTGAVPFPECLRFVAVNLAALDPFQAVDAIRTAREAIGSKVILNASVGFNVTLCGTNHKLPCAVSDIDAALVPFLQDEIATRFAEGTAWAAFAMQPDVVENTLLAQAAGNERAVTDTSGALGASYPGLQQAKLASPIAIATQLPTLQALLGDSSLWTGTVAGLPSLSLDSAVIANLQDDFVDLVLNPVSGANLTLVGSTINAALPSDLQLSASSNTGADLVAVGENITGLDLKIKKGTSFAAPQVAGLAAYLWLLDPGLANSPVSETLDLIRATGHASVAAGTIVDAYAAVLALDARNGNMRIRAALLDVNDDGVFDAKDLQIFSDKYGLADPNTPSVPEAADYGRYDLNGDGLTGGITTARFDLDAGALDGNGAPVIASVDTPIEGFQITFNEAALSDIQILCFYAYSPLYASDSGGPNDLARTALLGPDHCVGARLDLAMPAQVFGSATLNTIITVPAGSGQFAPASGVLAEFVPTCATVSPSSARADANGAVTTTVTPQAGCASLSVLVVVRADPDKTPLAQKSIGAAISGGVHFGVRTDFFTQTSATALTHQVFAQPEVLLTLVDLSADARNDSPPFPTLPLMTDVAQTFVGQLFDSDQILYDANPAHYTLVVQADGPVLASPNDPTASDSSGTFTATVTCTESGQGDTSSTDDDPRTHPVDYPDGTTQSIGSMSLEPAPAGGISFSVSGALTQTPTGSGQRNPEVFGSIEMHWDDGGGSQGVTVQLNDSQAPAANPTIAQSVHLSAGADMGVAWNIGCRLPAGGFSGDRSSSVTGTVTVTYTLAQ